MVPISDAPSEENHVGCMVRSRAMVTPKTKARMPSSRRRCRHDFKTFALMVILAAGSRKSRSLRSPHHAWFQ